MRSNLIGEGKSMTRRFLIGLLVLLVTIGAGRTQPAPTPPPASKEDESETEDICLQKIEVLPGSEFS